MVSETHELNKQDYDEFKPFRSYAKEILKCFESILGRLDMNDYVYRRI